MAAGPSLLIHTQDICHNYKISLEKFRAQQRGSSSGGGHIVPVLKSNAYGCGALNIWPCLDRMLDQSRDAHGKKLGPKEVFVANLEEALELRSHFPDTTIFTLSGPFKHEREEFITHDITPVLHHYLQLEEWHDICRTEGKNFPCVLFLETGLMRTGLQEKDLLRAQTKGLLASLNVHSYISHLAFGSLTTKHPYHQAQAKTFLDMANRFFPKSKRSLRASSGIEIPIPFQEDFARVGGSLYGPMPMLSEETNRPFRQALTLVAPVISIHEVKKGAGVGYGHHFTAPKDLRVGLVGFGYADGCPYDAKNQGFVAFQGHRLPVLGDIFMDYLLVDFTQVPESQINHAAESDARFQDSVPRVEIFGPHITFEEVQSFSQKGFRKVTTALGRRVKRVVISE